MNSAINLVVLVIRMVAPIGIYLDATSHFIGKAADQKKGFLTNWRPAEWAICCMMLGPFGLIAYIGKRKDLIAQAKIYPVYVGRNERYGVIVGLLLLALLFGASYFSGNDDNFGNPRPGDSAPGHQATVSHSV